MVDHATKTKSSIQFSLKQLFLGLLVFCFLLAVYSWLGLCTTTFVTAVVLWLVGMRAEGKLARYPLAAAFCAAILTSAGLFLFELESHDRRRGPQCTNNLKQIGFALHNYHDRYGSLPPAVTYDALGQPMHSWRALLLPFLDEPILYQQYRLDEPWDGPHNRHLHTQMPKVYRCDHDTWARKRTTSFLAIVGPGTAWPTDGVMTFDDFLDGTSNTLIVVESHNSGIGWLEPSDVDVMTMKNQINAPGRGISSFHKGGAHVLRADGSVRFLADTTPAAEIQDLITPAGNEKSATP